MGLGLRLVFDKPYSGLRSRPSYATILFLVGAMGYLACLRVRTVSGADWEAEKYRGMLCALLLDAYYRDRGVVLAQSSQEVRA